MRTFKQSYDMLVEAYMRDEIKPLDACFCFCGTLACNTRTWFMEGRAARGKVCEFGRTRAQKSLDETTDNTYTIDEILKLEAVFLNYINEQGLSGSSMIDPNYEQILFEAFEVTLDLLRDIHIAKGQNPDEETIPAFTKRQLATI